MECKNIAKRGHTLYITWSKQVTSNSISLMFDSVMPILQKDIMEKKYMYMHIHVYVYRHLLLLQSTLLEGLFLYYTDEQENLRKLNMFFCDFVYKNEIKSALTVIC